MKTPKSGAFRRLVCAGAFAAAVCSTCAAEYYATVNGAGSKTGLSWANAADQNGLQTLINNMAAGDTVNIGSGTYSTTINITSGGASASQRKVIRGVNTGAGLPVFAGSRAGTTGYDNQDNTSNGVTFTGSTSAAIRWVTIQDLVVRNHGAAVLFRSPDSRSSSSNSLPRFPNRECFSDIIIDNVDGTELYLGVMLVQATRVIVMDCDFVRLGFRGFNTWSYCSHITFDNCTAQGLGDNDTVSTWTMNAVPTGFYATDVSSAGEINNLTYIDCVAKRFLTNNGNSGSTTYWNGDGFTSEENSYNFTYIRCVAIENEDGGFDDKAGDLLFDGCVALKNKRGFRYHAAALPNVSGVSANATYRHSLAAYSVKRGGSSSQDGFWIANDNNAPTNTVVTIENCTSHNNTDAAIKLDNGLAITVNVTNSILSSDTATSAAGISVVNAGTLNIASSTATYRPNNGTNPNFVAPSANWTGSPANAFDSQTYGSAKGYHSSNIGSGGGTPNSVPNITTTSLPGGTVGVAYSQTLAATGGDGALVWSVASGSLPAGLSLSGGGAISGTPSTSGTANFTVRVADSDGLTGSTDEDTQALSITIAASGGGGGSPVTVSFQNGVSGYAGTSDTTLKSGSANSNFGNASTLEIDGDPDQAVLLRFDLSSIPTSATVTNVTLTFAVTNNSSDSYEIYALKRAFAEGSATWNAAASGTNWQTAGANGANDRETTVLGAITASSGSSVTVTLNSSGRTKVQSWIADAATNHGFVILDYAAGDGLDLRSRETGTATQRPKITITYQ